MAAALTDVDREHLRLLAIGHYVLAGLAALWACFPVIHFVAGLGLLGASTTQGSEERLPMALAGGAFSAIAGCLILTGWAFAAAIGLAAKRLNERTHHTFCIVVAAAEAALCMPFGTILGVLAVVVLSRPAVKAAFAPGLPSR